MNTINKSEVPQGPSKRKEIAKQPMSYLDFISFYNINESLAVSQHELPPPANTMSAMQLMRHEKKNFYKPPVPFNKEFDHMANSENL
jgi:hypothetical protein